jgi:hypothetical protein
MIAALPPPVPCRAAFLKSLECKEPETIWLYLAHAFQAERYAQLRQKGVRWGLRAWIAERVFAGAEDEMDREERGLVRRSSRTAEERSRTVPDETGRRIASILSTGETAAAAEALQWASELADVDPLFCRFAQGAMPALASGNPHPLLTINAARWGAHLLGPERAGPLLECMITRAVEGSGR